VRSAGTPDAVEHLRDAVESRRHIFGGEPTVDQAIAFLAGFDCAWGYTLLRGYQEWLVVRLGGGYNIHWSALARKLALRLDPYETIPTDSTGQAQGAGTRALESVVEFLEEINLLDGRRALYARYEVQRKADNLP
jgi:hypothetical protein